MTTDLIPELPDDAALAFGDSLLGLLAGRADARFQTVDMVGD